jgi:Protease inhibitor Inh
MSDRYLIIAVIALLVAPVGERASAQAPAQGASDAAKAMVGGWELSNADRDKTCTINFKLGPNAATYPIDLDKKCGEAFPSIRPVVAWTFGKNDMLMLIDNTGKPVLELLEVEGGMYEGLRPNEGRYFLQNAAVAAASRDKPADDLFGEWAFVRVGSGGGKPICAITLANEAADADSFAIQVKPGCDALITSFAPKSWKMDRGQLLMLSPKGQIWRFEENDPTTWMRIPAARQPLALVKQ